MGKLPHLYVDSDETDNNSSVENLKNKRKPSILKYTTGNVKKKKCKIHSKSEPEDSDARSRSSHSQSLKSRIQGILKHDRDKARSCSSDDDEDVGPSKDTLSQSKYLVGRVPRPAGCKPGRGGGVAIIVKKNLKTAQKVTGINLVKSWHSSNRHHVIENVDDVIEKFFKILEEKREFNIMDKHQSLRVQQSSTNDPKKKRSTKGLGRKFSY